jgi:hypothetical protein
VQHKVQGLVQPTRAQTDFNEPLAHQIRVKGHLGVEWADWFDGMTITLEEDGETLLAGPVVDQAALFACSEKCVISACHCSRSSGLNPTRQMGQTSNRDTGH